MVAHGEKGGLNFLYTLFQIGNVAAFGVGIENGAFLHQACFHPKLAWQIQHGALLRLDLLRSGHLPACRQQA